MIKQAVLAGLDAIDGAFATITPGLFQERATLITVLFHGLYPRASDTITNDFDPQQRVTIEDFRLFIETFLSCGYKAVSPRDLDGGLQHGRKYLMITFDDGYFNNSFALDILAEFQVPATFFISTDFVEEEKSFWWDVLSREMHKHGSSEEKKSATLRKLKRWKHEEIEAYLIATFGKAALRPVGDLDRPFTHSELKEFAANPLVHLGNHTSSHAVLTNYSRAEVAQQIRSCQRVLTEIGGYAPTIIAYPSGRYSRDVIAVALAEGLTAGITLRSYKNAVPLRSAKARMTLGRFTLYGGRDICRQCKVFRSDFGPGRLVKSLKQHIELDLLT